MQLSRRQLLFSGAAASLALTLPNRRKAAAAVADSKKNLIIVLVYGGWDTMYAVDPKLPHAGIDVPPDGTIVNHGANLDILEDPSRPAVTDFFARHAAITAIVRGIRLPGISHRACMQQILTGARNETSPDAAAIVAHANSPELPIPYLVLGDAAFAGPYAASMGRVGASNQLVGLLDPRSAFPVDSRPVAFEPTRADADAIRAYTVARTERERAVRGATGYNKRRVDDFVESLDRGDRLRTLRDRFGARNTSLDLAAQRSLALDAIAGGVSRTVMLSSHLSWDTHERNIQQSISHQQLFANLTALVDDLGTRMMLDETVVAVISEMGRTPKLNGDPADPDKRGRDHWPVTSAMLIGGGVLGGRAYGGTTATGEAELVDLATGELSATGRTIEPRHFMAGLLSLCGVDPTDHLPGAEVLDAFVP